MNCAIDGGKPASRGNADVFHVGEVLAGEVAHHALVLAHAAARALDAAAENDGERLFQHGVVEFALEYALGDVHEATEDESLVGVVGGCVAQVCQTISQVARLVLQAAGEEDFSAGLWA